MNTNLFTRFRFILCAAFSLLLTASRGAAANSTPPDKVERASAQIAAEMFSQVHYLQHPLDQEMSAKFYTQYLNALDGYHMHFLQSDLDEFEPYRTKLDTLTLKDGDTSLARLVFARFLQRFEQRITYTTNLIMTGKFDFSGHERYTPDRRKAQAPKTMDELHELWRQDLRYIYLNEKLAAKDIQFNGPLEDGAKGDSSIHLTKDKTHPLAFSILPQKFYTQNHHLLGSLTVSTNGTNAVITLEGHDWKKGKKSDKDIYSESGEKLGSVAVRYSTNITTPTNAISQGDSQKTFLTNASTVAAQYPHWFAQIQLNQKNMADVVTNLTKRYVRLQKNYRDYTSDNVVDLYFNSLARAYDPHSDYMGREESEEFNIQMKLSLFGIGARLTTTDDGYCKIQDLIPGPAQKSGKVKAEDRIVAVAQGTNEPVDVINMKLSKVVNLIRGPKGTEVRLTLIPVDAVDSSVRKTVPLIRAEIQMEDSRAKAMLYEAPGKNGTVQRLGVIDLPGFYADQDRDKKLEDRKTTTGDVARLLKRLMQEKVDGVVLDLRQNGGGYLDEAISLTGLFIKPGPVVQTKTFDGTIEIDKSQEPKPLYEGPLVILISRFSASASEILAGALQDYGRALIVGDHATYGKGTVQTKLDLNPYLVRKGITPAYEPGDAIKITIKKFYRAGGSSTQNKGVLSDVELPSKTSFAEVGEEFMDNAMEWDTVSSADPVNMNMVKPYLAELKKRSAARLQADKELVYWSEDVEHFKKIVQEKSVSMNEAERIADSNRDKARLEARKKERATRKKSDEKSFDITFKNIDNPKLLPPEVKTNETAAASSEIDFDEDGELADTKAPGSDTVLLDETKRILSDYIALMKKDPSISKAQ